MANWFTIRPGTAPLRRFVYAERFGSRAGIQQRDGVAIRNDRYKLIRWTTPVREQFFDLALDGFEKNDLTRRALTAIEKQNYDALRAEVVTLMGS